MFSSGRQADTGIKSKCVCFHLSWLRLDLLALCNFFQTLLQHKHYYSIFEPHFVDMSVKIDTQRGGLNWFKT